MTDLEIGPLEQADPQPHVVSGGSAESSSKKREKRERKSVKTIVKEPKKRVKKSSSSPIEVDQKITDLRNELKLLTLKSAELKGLSDTELKNQLAKIGKMKEKDLIFELEKLRVQTSSSWTKNLSKCMTEGYGLIADLALKTEGHILNEVREDKNLQASVHGELEKYAFDMNSKARIAMLLAVDTAKGYFSKKASLPFGPPLLIRQNAIVMAPIPISTTIEKKGETIK